MPDFDQFSQVKEIIPGSFYFACLRSPDAARNIVASSTAIYYCIDSDLLYEPFYADFGPLNLGQSFRFCQRTALLVQEAQQSKKKLIYFCGPTAQQRANAAVLVGVFAVLQLHQNSAQAYQNVDFLAPFLPFRDASCGPSTFHLTVLHCIQGIAKAKEVGFIDWHKPNSKFDVGEYEHYEQVENGDLNWIIPGKLVAFSGPSATAREFYGYRSYVPEDYHSYFKKKGVTAIVRLNKQMYDSRRFVSGGFRHYELYFPDGSCPDDNILHKFMDIVETEPGCLAIHCKAGLGRTGVLICSYMIKHYGFTPEEAIGYIRVCRPGSVIGPQQNYLLQNAPRLVAEGNAMRARKSQEIRSIPPAAKRSSSGSNIQVNLNATSGSLVDRLGASPLAAGGNSAQVEALRSSLMKGLSVGNSAQDSTNSYASKPAAQTLNKTPGSFKGASGVAAAGPPQRTGSFQNNVSSLISTGFGFRRPVEVPGSPGGSPPPSPSGKSGVARTLAPNGQPRKVPAALFDQGTDQQLLADAEEDIPAAGAARWSIGAGVGEAR